ncbi:hypothetical protein AGMMS49960_06620 [Betaproteobacteria bacterium]|nr:hypothetical protein AGMMS49960_06620 [Betaproteobacteria bacterium]GHU22016.1 hypothetical protein AGMMS50243_20770 [Betaproteobacteria bacterium]
MENLFALRRVKMHVRLMISVMVMVAISSFVSTKADAAVIYADTIIDYYDSGAGPYTWPYGGYWYGPGMGGSFPIPVTLANLLDGSPSTFVSLPQGSYVTLGFSNGFLFDGPGLDLFISELGGNDELAAIWISSDWGASFTYLGQATTDTVTGYDFASIGYSGTVNAVRVVGLDNFGPSPGFDLAFVRGFEGSSVMTTPVPEPATNALLLAGLCLIGIVARRRNNLNRR